MRGTEGGGRSPFFSPDGQWVGFWAQGQLKKVSINGGPPVTLGDAQNLLGASWGADDRIVFGKGPEGIQRVSAAGGTPEVLIPMDSANGEEGHGPQILPGGQVVLFTLRSGGASWDDAQIVAQLLETAERKILLEGGTDARYVPTGSWHCPWKEIASRGSWSGRNMKNVARHSRRTAGGSLMCPM